MKDYLKMADVFESSCNVPVFNDDEMYCGDSFIAEFNSRKSALMAAHAINSHDELVAMNKELLEGLKRVVFDLNELSNNSDGVIGLHQNGDIARWSSLRSGGFNEGWLLSIDEAEGTIEKMEGGAS